MEQIIYKITNNKTSSMCTVLLRNRLTENATTLFLVDPVTNRVDHGYTERLEIRDLLLMFVAANLLKYSTIQPTRFSIILCIHIIPL